MQKKAFILVRLKTQSNKLMKQCAFTLAEVLITLGIIGIVAAMTIPTLINNYQKTQYVSGLKKAYAQFNQILQQMAVESGENDSIASYFGADNLYVDAIKSHLKILKDCGTAQNEDCFAKFDDYLDGSAGAASTEWNSYVRSNQKIITADGMSLSFYSHGTSCTSNRGFAEAPNAPTTNHSCGIVYIDVNGLEKPNYWGKDVFTFYITSNKSPVIYPLGGFYRAGGGNGTMATGGDGWWNYSNGNFCSDNAGKKLGVYCAGRVIEKGWTMDY